VSRRSGPPARRLPPVLVAMLRAALGSPEEFAEHWPALRPTLEPDALRDYEAIRLVPVVHRALVASCIDDPLEPRLRGVRRRYWYENQLQRARLADVTAALGEAGITSLVVKGMDLAFRYYEDPGLRPMRDVDVLVPTAAAGDAVDALVAAGWALHRRPLVRGYAASSHGMPLEQPDGNQVDLHWHLREAFITGDPLRSDGAFWAASESFGEAIQPRCLAAEDLLLLVLVGGVTTPGAQWVADAVQIVRSRPTLDWDRLVARTEEYRVTVPVLAALACVDEVVGPLAPGAVVSAVGRLPRPRHVVRAYRRVLAVPELHPGGPPLVFLARSWVHTSANWSRRERWRRAPQWLADRWGVPDVWHVGAPVLRRSVAGIRRMLGRPPVSDAANPQPRRRDPGTAGR
jgi:Uncharacterised nucleotidyltransferase